MNCSHHMISKSTNIHSPFVKSDDNDVSGKSLELATSFTGG